MPEGETQESAPAEAAPVESKGLLGGATGQVQLPDWMGDIDDSVMLGDDKLKESSVLGKYQTQAEANKAHVELAKAFGNTMPRPGESDTPEQQAKFRKAIGVPDSADGYEVKVGEVAPGVTVSDEMVGEFKKIAHGLALTPVQTQGLIDYQLKSMNTQVANSTISQEDAMTALREGDENNAPWGPETEKNIGIANQGLKALGLGEFAEMLDKTGYGSHPTMVRGLHAIGLKMQEIGLIGEAENQYVGATLAAEKRDKILGDMNHVYYQAKGTPGKQAAIDEVDRLNRIIENDAASKK